MWNVNDWKKQKNPWRKNFKLIFSGTVKKNCSRHNSMPEKFRTLFKYDMPDILVEIVDLKLCSSLKWDVV